MEVVSASQDVAVAASFLFQLWRRKLVRLKQLIQGHGLSPQQGWALTETLNLTLSTQPWRRDLPSTSPAAESSRKGAGAQRALACSFLGRCSWLQV